MGVKNTEEEEEEKEWKVGREEPRFVRRSKEGRGVERRRGRERSRRAASRKSRRE